MSLSEARQDVGDLSTWRPLAVDQALLELAWILEDRANISFWDALVVASDNRLGCEYLLTEDLQDGQVFDGTLVIDPFIHDPAGFVA